MVFAAPDGVAPAELDLWDDDLARRRWRRRWPGPSSWSGRPAGRPPDPLSSADYSDSRVEVALVTTTGISSRRRRTNAFLSADAIAGEGADTQTGGGYSVGRSPGDLVPDKATGDAVLRATRMLGATKPRSAPLHGGLRPGDLDAAGVVASALVRRGGPQGTLLLRRPHRRRGGGELGHPGRRPHRPRAYGAASLDGEGLACRRNVLIYDGFLRMFVYNTFSARRAGMPSTASAVRAGFAGTP